MVPHLLAIFLLGTSAQIERQRITPYEASLVSTAARVCKVAQKPVSVRLLRTLMEVERTIGIPDYARGITLVAACRESGYRAAPKRGDGGKAVGMLQWWPWWERVYGFDREREPFIGVAATLHHVNTLVQKAIRKCGRLRPFLNAYTWVMSGPRGHRCRHNRHVRTLLRWRRMARRNIETKKHR